MPTTDVDGFVRRAQGYALGALPVLFVMVFALHFRHWRDFFTFRLSYVARPARDTVTALIALGGRRPVLHDPHMLGYLGLPLFLLTAFGLYRLGRTVRPRLALLGVALSATGAIYLGGLFGSWTAFFGIGMVDPAYTDGAIASFAVLTAPHGALLVSMVLSKMAIIGLVVQALALFGTGVVPRWSSAVAAIGCVLIVLFWDLDNWMLIGSVLMLAGFVPMSRRLVASRPAIESRD